MEIRSQNLTAAAIHLKVACSITTQSIDGATSWSGSSHNLVAETLILPPDHPGAGCTCNNRKEVVEVKSCPNP